jgi:hypothetical protein
VNTDRNHLDAETVAAWMDGGLDSASLAAAEAHASNCERCQALLATVTKTMPQETGSLEAASIGANWWRWWMTPIAAAAAAVTLWMVVPQERLRQVATAPSLQMTAPAAPAAESARARDEAAPPKAETAAPSDPQPGRQRPAEGGQFAEGKRKADTAPRAAQEKPQVAPGKLGAAANVADAVGAKDRRDNKAEERLARVEAEPPRAPAAQMAAAPAAAAPAESAAARESAITQLRKQTTPLVFVSPDPRFRWRATAAGVEFSVDGGRTWLPVRLPQGEVITGGASPAPLACWLVGRRGLVLLATDGTNFTRLPFPESVDLVAVSSPEPRIATVTTADGRRFRTENAGRSWSLQDFVAAPF